MKRFCTIAVLAGVFFVGCSNEEPAPLPALKPVELPSGVVGQYSGRLPCDSCKVRMIRMTLAEDSSAIAVQTIVNDTMVVDTLKGVYSVDGEKMKLALSEGAVKWSFKRDTTGNLTLLTGAGTVYQDDDGMEAKLIRIFAAPKGEK